MEVIGTVAAFIGVLVVLVLVHELGHFLVAKRAGITVEEFGVGFPPRIASVTWHGTRYSLNSIPLGGFVRMPTRTSLSPGLAGSNPTPVSVTAVPGTPLFVLAL